MSRWMFVGVFGLFGCGPVIAEFSGGIEQGPDATVPGEDATDATEEPEVPPIQLVSGTWTLVGVETREDPCGWNPQVYEWTRLTIDSFLPSAFTVAGDANAFDIKAIDYGAQETVRCTFEGDAFTCTQQVVDPNPVTSFWPRNWLYEIDFSGRYVDDGRIEGQAVVAYPKVDDSSAYWLRVNDMDPLDCTQVYALTMAVSDPE